MLVVKRSTLGRQDVMAFFSIKIQICVVAAQFVFHMSNQGEEAGVKGG